MRALPVGIGLALAATGIAWVLRRRFGLPAWVVVMVVAIAWFTPMGDAISVLMLRRRLRGGPRGT